MTEKRTIQPDDLFRLKTVIGGALSPDGRRIVYAINAVDREKDADAMTLWMLDLESGQTRQITSGPLDSAPAFSPDGRLLAFIGRRNAVPQVYVLPVDGGEARAVTQMKHGVGATVDWSPDSKQLAFTASSAEETHDPTKPYRVTRHVYRFDGLGYVEKLVQDVYVIAVEGGEPRRITRNRSMNSAPQWSPDGSELAFVTTLPPEGYRLLPALTISDLEGNMRELVPEFSGTFRWLPDGKRIAYIGAPPGSPAGTKQDLWLIERTGGDPQCRTAGLQVGVGDGLQADFPKLFMMMGQQKIRITADGKTAYVQGQEYGTMPVYRVALSGRESVRQIVGGKRACLFQDASAERLVYVVSEPNSPSELYTAALDGSGERQLTHVNQAVLDALLLPEVERLTFAGVDGEEVEGWVMKPPTGKAPYPTIQYIHGGPRSAFGYVFSFDFQMLAGAGYAVLFINYHGSTGYGTAFSTRLTGHYCEADHFDLMAGLDCAIERGLADPDRLGVAGLSFGGYLSCWAVGQTDRFKAAVPENPVADRISGFGTGDLGLVISLQGIAGKPWEVRDAYVKASPITHAHNCTTPTLLIQGEADYRCPAIQSEQFYTTLKAVGCKVEMLRLPNSPHTGAINGPPPIRRAQNEALLDWMNRHVLGRPARTDII